MTMVNRIVLMLTGMPLFIGFCGNVTAKTMNVNREEEKAWVYYTLPLPHKIAISEKCMVKPGDICVSTRPNADAVEQNAAAILRDFIKEKTGEVPSGKGFEIVMGILDRDGKVGEIALRNAGKLKDFPNSDQAYIIEPVGKNKLVIGALDSKGVFYGMHTLRQLLAREIGAKAVAVPMAWVEDWPDFANRGLWNCCLTMYPELSMVKLNYTKNYASQFMLAVQPPDKEDGQPAPLMTWHTNTLSEAKALYEDGKRYAFFNVPCITHINFWPQQKYWEEILRMYPDLAGKGDTAFQSGKTTDPRAFRVPCPSHPMLRKIIADTLMLYADAGIMEVSVWTTEYYSYCSCANCIKKGEGPRQFILEARAIAGAGEDIRKKYPDFKVRLFGIPINYMSSSADPSVIESAKTAWEREMPIIMKELPKEVILESVYTLYQTDKNGNQYVPVLDEYAAKGYKLIEYTAGRPAIPIYHNNFCKLPSLRGMIINRYEAKWYGVLRWMLFSVEHEQTLRFASHDIDALAEWGWNAKGRTVSEFIRAWAAVSGFNPPEPVVEWIEYAMKRDVLNDFDTGSLGKQWLEDMMNMMKRGEPLTTKFDICRRVDYTAAFQDLEKMLQLSRAINKEFTIRTEYLMAEYKELAAIKDLIERDSRKADPPAMLEAVKQLGQAIDERSRAFDAMTALFGGIPYVYSRRKPDFEGQRLIIKNGILPLISKKNAVEAAVASPPYYIGEILPTPKTATYRDEFIPVYDIVASKPLADVIAGSAKSEQLAAQDFIARVCELAGLASPNFQPRSAQEPIPEGNMICLGSLPANHTAKLLALRPGLALSPIPKGEQGYVIRTVREGERFICLAAGGGPMGTYFAAMSLVQLLKVEDGKVLLRAVTVDDWPTFEMRGTCCYDPDQARWLALARFSTLDMNYSSVGINNWRNPDCETNKAYSKKVAALWDWGVPRGLWPVQYVNPLYVTGYKDDVSMKIQVSDPAQIDDLARTFRISLDRGGTWIMLALDDFSSSALPYVITNEEDRKTFKSLGECHGTLARELHARLKKTHPNFHMIVCPAYYSTYLGKVVEEGEEKYLREFGRLVPEDVLIVWAGMESRYRARKITVEQVRYFTDLIGRKPYLWDNTIYARHNPPDYVLDPFSSEYPEHFWEMTAGGLHNNGGVSEIYKVGCLVYGDYAWNPEAYDPAKSLDKALRMVLGEGCAADANAFRENYYAVRDPYKYRAALAAGKISRMKDEELVKAFGSSFTRKDFEDIAAKVEAMDAALARLKEKSPNKPLVEALEALAPPLRFSAQVLKKRGDALMKETNLFSGKTEVDMDWNEDVLMKEMELLSGKTEVDIDWNVGVKASNNARLPCLTGENVSSFWEYPAVREFISWQSAVVPEKSKGEKVTFIMASGIGCNLGEGFYDLFMNGRKILEVNTSYGATITWKSELATGKFTTTYIDKNKDIFGIFSVTVNPEAMEYGKSQKFEMKGKASSGYGWFSISEVKNLKSLNVKELRAKMNKQ